MRGRGPAQAVALLLVLLGCDAAPAAVPAVAKGPAATAAVTPPAVAKPGPEPASTCGVEPAPMQSFDPASVACWAEAALPADDLRYAPMSTQGLQPVAATSWAEVQRIVNEADGAVQVTLSGSFTIDSPLVISGKDQAVQITGPADITCGAEGLSAVTITRSITVILQDLTISNCTETAIAINTTTALKPSPVTASGASKDAPAPNVLLKNVVVSNCEGGLGAAVRALNSRVVVENSKFTGNTAAGCGGGLYAANSALLVLDSVFANNEGSSTMDYSNMDECRGGAIHAQKSWVGIARSSFTNNRGANGSAVLLHMPVGMAHIQDCSFENNAPRAGTGVDFASSAGAVGVVGYPDLSELGRGAGFKCTTPAAGLAVVRSTFRNNTCVVNGGRGGAINSNDGFLALINNTFFGTAVGIDTPGVELEAALNGGCVALDTGTLYMKGSSFTGCSAHFLGGALSMRGVYSVIQDTAFHGSSADTGGCVRATNGIHWFKNITVTKCHALNAGGGVYLESNAELDVHVEQSIIQHNTLTGRGGGMRAEAPAEDAKLLLSIHGSTITHNTGSLGGGLAISDVTRADLRGNVISHNIALKEGGGFMCQNTLLTKDAISLTRNTWRNNTASMYGGAIYLHPCNATVHEDKILGNRAKQDGGGVMARGGNKTTLQSVQVSCNSALTGAGVSIKVSEDGVDSAVTLTCSNVTANGVAGDATAQDSCLSQLAAAGAAAADTDALLTAAAAAAATPAADAAAYGSEKGGGIFVAAGRLATVVASTVGGNVASKSGAGIHVDGGDAYLELSGASDGSAQTVVSHNLCPAGAGGAVYLGGVSGMYAVDASLSNNQALFGGAVFAFSSDALAELELATLNNNTAAVGGAVATLGGSIVTCIADCQFAYNTAKVGGALMLHEGASNFTATEFISNVAAAATGAAAATAPTTIQYKLGPVPTSAGGAVYVWNGNLKLLECDLSNNVAWGSNGRGGAVYVDDSSLTLDASVLSDNYASTAGGAVLLGPTGSHTLKVSESKFSGNAARRFGGAVAAGLLLPGDAAAANEQARAKRPASSWSLSFVGTTFTNNTAGSQGGALACSMCSDVAIAGSSFKANAAVQTGGGLSCVGCSQYAADACSFQSNSAASGAGACILAAGKSSTISDSKFVGNSAGQEASNAATYRLDRAAAAAESLIQPEVSKLTAVMPGSLSAAMLSSQQTLPACGVVGTGGGLCLGLWDTGFKLQGSSSFVNNSALYGAGLFIESCPKGGLDCPVDINPRVMVFKDNALADGGLSMGPGMARRHLLQATGPVATDIAGLQNNASGDDSLGSGADVYATNATVLVAATVQPAAAAGAAVGAAKAAAVISQSTAAARPAVQPAAAVQPTVAAAAAAAAGAAKASSTLTSAAGAGHRRALQQTSGSSSSSSVAAAAAKADASLAVARELASSTGGLATGPANLGQVQWTAVNPAAANNAATNATAEVVDLGTLDENNRLQGVKMVILDQLGLPVSDGVAQQLAVVAQLGCKGCEVGGISKVQPINGTAVFDNMQIMAPPGSNQTVTFTLLNTTGAELGTKQAGKVQLRTCVWGQATKVDGCATCSYPLFTLSAPAKNQECSICPANALNCSGTTILPDSGYWQSGPLSTNMIKCPRRTACRRDGAATKKLACLQQQLLIVTNQESLATSADIFRYKQPSAFDTLREECQPILEQLAKAAPPAAMMSHRQLLQAGPAFITFPTAQPVVRDNATDLNTQQMAVFTGLTDLYDITAQYEALLCAEGYQGKLCEHCLFPGTEQSGAWGVTYNGVCGKCPSRRFSIASYFLSRLFDFAIMGILVITTLIEMNKRRAEVMKQRRQAVARLAAAATSTGSGVLSSMPSLPATPAASTTTSVISGVAAAAATDDTATSKKPDKIWRPTVSDIHEVSDVREKGSAVSRAETAASGASTRQYSAAELAQLESMGASRGSHYESASSFAYQPETATIDETAELARLDEPMHPSMSQQYSQHSQAGLLPERVSSTAEGRAMTAPDTETAHSVIVETAGPLPQRSVAPAAAAPSTAAAYTGRMIETKQGLVPASAAAAQVPAPTGSGLLVVGSQNVMFKKPLRRVPLFMREHTKQGKQNVASYTPANLTMGQLFEVLKDFLQVIAILQTVLLSWQTATSAIAAAIAGVSVTPMSTRAWISLDCLLPRTLTVADQLPFYHLAAQLVLPFCYTIVVLLIFCVYAIATSIRTKQPLWRDVMSRRLKGPIISSMLMIVSYFYPAFAYAILGVFSCRHLDPEGDTNMIPGEVRLARGWYWSADLDRQCFVDPTHRALVFGLGIPGSLLLLAYPILQGIVLSRQVAAGNLKGDSDWFIHYGHLVADFRPRLFYWGSIVELRKLVLVAVVLGLESAGIVSQLMGASLVLLAYCAATMGLLPYPYRVLNRLHLSTGGVLLAVVWINLFVAAGDDDGDVLSAGFTGRRSFGLQMLSAVLVLAMVLVLVVLFGFRLYTQLMEMLDIDKDGKVTKADINALLQRLQGEGGIMANLLSCFRPRARVAHRGMKQKGVRAAPAASP